MSVCLSAKDWKRFPAGEVQNKVEENTAPLCIMRCWFDGGGGKRIEKEYRNDSLLCSSNAPETAEDLLLFHATLNISDYQTCSFDCYSICQYFVCVTYLGWCCSRRGLSTEERRSGQRTVVYCGANKEKMPSDRNIKGRKRSRKEWEKVNKTKQAYMRVRDWKSMNPQVFAKPFSPKVLN